MSPILTAEEVAELLRCSVRTIEDHARAGRIPGHKFGDGWVFAADLVVEAVKEMSLEGAKRRRRPDLTKQVAPSGALGVIHAVPKNASTGSRRGRGRPRRKAQNMTAELLSLPGLALLPPEAVAC